MLKSVQVIEISTGYLIAKYPISITLELTFDIDYFDEAWLHAKYDGFVIREKRSEYNIVFC